MMSPSTPARVRNAPALACSCVRTPRSQSNRLEPALSVEFNTVCCAEVKLVHLKGTPPVPFQVRMFRLVGVSTVIVLVGTPPEVPMLAQPPPVSTQLLSHWDVVDTLRTPLVLTMASDTKEPVQLLGLYDAR